MLEIASINLSVAKGTAKQPAPAAEVTPLGLAGDAHAGHGHRQVSLLGAAAIRAFEQETGRTVHPGEFGENLTVRGLADNQVRLLDRFRSGALLLEVTQIGKQCHGDTCAIFRDVGRCIMPKVGVFCRVIHPGPLQAGAVLEWEPFTLRGALITVSDRASRGEYTDRSGPCLRGLVEAFFEPRPWRLALEQALVPDDLDRLRAELAARVAAGTDFICTLGGTGLGPRDVTPEAVMSLAPRMIPGIMEHLRIKFGAQHPAALLSRGVAALAGSSLIFTLPGSVRAAEEYGPEILRLLEHAMFMVRGIDRH